MNVKQKYFEIFHKNPSWYCSAPGRVNLLGEHVDYNDGPVLPLAIDLHVDLYARPNSTDQVRLYALDFNDHEEFLISKLETKENLSGKAIVDWAQYPAGVAWALDKAGFPLCGIDAVYTSRIPIGTGLGSSAAVEAAFALLWQSIYQSSIDRLALAMICQRAENDYVGVPGGLMDQFASLCGRKDHVLYLDTRNTYWEPIAIPFGGEIVIIDSGIQHKLVDSRYAERRKGCDRAVKELAQELPEIHSLRDITSIEFAAYGFNLPEPERSYAEHVVKEIARVYSAVDALKLGNLQSLGALMFAGHASLRDLYKVSHSSLDTLVEIARQFPGCYGARLTGAGFGGCTVNLVAEKKSQEFLEFILLKYHNITGQIASGYICQPSQGATAIPLMEID